MYEEQLKHLTPAVTYTKDKAFVPSFMEDWIFYQVEFVNNVWRDGTESNVNNDDNLLGFNFNQVS